MSAGFLAGLFAPDLPRWACEFRSDGVVVVGATSDRKGVAKSASRSFPAGALSPDVKGSNIHDVAAVGSSLEGALGEAGFAGSELIVVIPDDAVRITLLDADSLPGAEAERTRFIRWRLKKHVPFDVAQAGLTYTVVSSNGTTRLMAVLSPESVIRQYERVVKDLGLHPGIVCPSTPAALNLTRDLRDPVDRLFMKVDPTSVVSAVLRGDVLRFYRKVSRSGPLEEAVHPTLMYFQDHLADGVSARIEEAILCVDAPDRDVEAEARRALEDLGLAVRPLYSPGIEDRLKPALGALQA